MTDGLHVYFSDDVCRVTLWQDLAIVDVAGVLDRPRMLRLEAAFRQLHRERGGNIGVLAVIRIGAPIPPAEARQHAIHIVKTCGDWIALIAVVLESAGIMTQMFKTVVRSINMLAGVSRLAVFDDLPAANAELFARVVSHTASPNDARLEHVVQSALDDYVPSTHAQAS